MPTDVSPTRAQNSGSPTPSTIGGDLTITGNVHSTGELHIDGHIQGDVHAASLILGENSRIDGNVSAEDVVIRGRLTGSVRALRVMLQSTSHVEGNLVQKNLAMEQGAYFEGESRRSDNPLAEDRFRLEDRATTKAKPSGERAERRQDRSSRSFVRSLNGSDDV
jgi:cytoskeletal protein CcmA (bactofilin family)